MERIKQELAALRKENGKLRVGERKFRRMFENASEYLYCHDLEGRFTDVNAEIRRAGGYTEAELLNMNIQNMLAPRFEGWFDRYRARILENRRDEGTIGILDRNGRERIIEYRNTLITDTEGAPYVQGIARDITERLLADRTHSLTEERYRSILESIEEGYYEVDLAGNLIFFNESICRMLGYTRDELMGMNNRQYMTRSDAKKVFQAFQKVYQTGESDKGVDWRLIRKDGSRVSIETSVSLMQDEKDRAVGFRGIVRDITERMRIEEELRRHRDHLEDLVEERTRELLAANRKLRNEIEERRRAEDELGKSREEYRELYESSRRREEVYRSLLHSSADAIVIYDLEGRTRYVSPSFTRIFGWTLEDVKNKPMPFVPESEKGRTSAVIQELKEQGRSFQGFETKRLTKDGRLLDVSISTSRYNDHEDRPAGVLVVLRDMTETRKLQAQLQHAQKMESMGTIASGVAHNFRNILAGISVNSELLQMKHGEDPALGDIAGRLSLYVKRGSHLVEGLMQFARKPREDTFRRADLVELLRETHDLISQSFDRRIEIHTSLPDSLPVLGDDPALRQVFMNLCTNARDAMPNGGTLFIRAESHGERARVEFADTGDGMDPETRKKCFDPFFTTKEVKAGTGLGLSTSYGIIRHHGGDIHVYSERGRGTTFRVILPMAVSETTHHEVSKTILPAYGDGRSILVVDDEECMLVAMQELLETLGYDVLTADAGDKAVRTYQTVRPAAVIMDRNMPGMDGVTCMKQILKTDPNAKVILISGYDPEGPHGVDEHTRSIMAGYMIKPVDLVELGRVLEGLFGL